MTSQHIIKTVLIMAGGTGGHVFPGLSLANYLRDQGIAVHWLGTDQGLEFRITKEARLPFHRITISGIRGKKLSTLIFAPFKMIKAIYQSFSIIKKLNPDVVIGMGGFVSGPGAIASWLLNRPLVIHEQNAKPGLTNKWLAPFAKKIFTAFPNVFPSHSKVTLIGNPVRVDIECLSAPTERGSVSRSPYHLLILGGSLGAEALNTMVPASLAMLPVSSRPKVYHQTGSAHLEATKARYQALGIDAEIVPFIENMAAAYLWADMVICRSGAMTIAELAMVGLGSILVPYPFAADDHQTANAAFMVAQGAAILIPQATLTASKLAEKISELSDPSMRLNMATAAYLSRRPKVVEKMWKIIAEEVCH